MFTKKILAAAITSQPSANGVADAIDFDGANDYLSRGSDLVGNTDGKTFTFSAWVWIKSGQTGIIGGTSGGAEKWGLYTDGAGIYLQFYNSSGTIVFEAYIAGPGSSIASQSFLHLLISIDVSNVANRFVYVNDQSATVTWTTYINTTLKFTHTNQYVGMAATTGSPKISGRLAHVYLDKTYRDLSVEANRRLFITADRKPTPKATLQALNPILYLPLDDPTQAGKNLGTGGDFTLNGVVARSGRGPNQFNAVYSDLDGAADYLSRASELVGSSNGNKFTVFFTLNIDTLQGAIFQIGTSDPSDRFYCRVDSSGALNLFGYNSSAIELLQCRTPNSTIKVKRNYVIAASFDLSNSLSKHIIVNGVSQTLTTTTFIDGLINFAGNRCNISKSAFGSDYVNGRLGNVFFDTKYIDLSVPANLAKFVTGTGIDAKPVDLGANGELPFGTAPLIYLPMYGNNVGKNYGTGGDFTVNSGPFPGARGPNEFWGNKADFDGTTGYLSRTSALAGVSASKTLSLSFWIWHDTTNVTKNVTGGNGGSEIVNIGRQDDNTWSVETSKFAFGGIGTGATGGPHHILVCIDLSSPAKRFVFVNGTQQSPTWYAYTDSNMNFTGWIPQIGASQSNLLFDGKLSEFYFTTDYIDFSQEANRLKFRDAFGNPVDLRPQIAAGTLPNPAIYMRFDPSNFGKNSGTGGDFVVNGTITDGGQL